MDKKEFVAKRNCLEWICIVTSFGSNVFHSELTFCVQILKRFFFLPSYFQKGLSLQKKPAVNQFSRLFLFEFFYFART